MKFISHRGNIDGPNPERENDPEYIQEALDKGFEVEVDVWFINGDFYLGHDYGQYKITNPDLLYDKRVWCHAKHIKALKEMIEENIHCFWHQNDNYTLTSNKYIWAYPLKIYNPHTIAVLPENNNVIPEHLVKCVGICSDNIAYYKKEFELIRLTKEIK